MEKTPKLIVNSPNLKYTDDYITADYSYEETLVTKNGDDLVVKPYQKSLQIRTGRRVGKVGVMLVGWGGNNGSTFTAAVLANRHQLSWSTKNGTMDSNWFGSITQASTVRLGMDSDGNDVNVPMCNLLPMVHPDDLVIDGWDISKLNLAESMVRAKVIDYDLQQKLRKEMTAMKPRPAIYDPDFIAANQADRATNLIHGTKYEQYLQVRADIKSFRDKHKLDKVIVLWTANTERFCEVRTGVHDTSENLTRALSDNDSEISPSTIFAMAAIDEGCCYINGSPQNTLVPGVVERAEKRGTFVAGDDFKSGQTKLKSVLVDFLVSAGLKPVSIVSYNHLGNNDGKNLSAPKQFRSKEITKSNVVDDVVASNSILYKPGEKPDHVVVIKYVPYVGDSKRAMDEYTSEILLHGTNTVAVHNTCEDSLLAVPLILDLVLLAELFSRVHFLTPNGEWSSMNAVLSPLAYLLKAPLVPAGAPVVNALFKQRACLENILRACLGLQPNHNMQLEHKVPFLMSELHSGAMFTAGSPPSKKQKVAHENGDSKRAMDEYTSEILLHGTNTVAVHNTCEDSLLAVPLILDLVLLAELFSRVHFLTPNGEWSSMNAVLSPLAYLLKAPLVPAGAPVVNALFKQRACLENILRACLGLQPNHNMQLEHKVPFLMSELHSGAMFTAGSPPSKKQKVAHENGDQ